MHVAPALTQFTAMLLRLFKFAVYLGSGVAVKTIFLSFYIEAPEEILFPSTLLGESNMKKENWITLLRF